MLTARQVKTLIGKMKKGYKFAVFHNKTGVLAACYKELPSAERKAEYCGGVVRAIKRLLFRETHVRPRVEERGCSACLKTLNEYTTDVRHLKRKKETVGACFVRDFNGKAALEVNSACQLCGHLYLRTYALEEI